MKFLLMCMLVFDLGIIPHGIGTKTEKINDKAESVNDMQNYTGYEPEYQHAEEGIIGDATSEHVTEEQEPIQEYVGVYELTAYAETGSPCADGDYPRVSHTAACNDPRLWHRWIYIEGLGTYYVHDTGGMSSNVIDIYLGDYDSCIQFGRQESNVYVIN